MAIISMNGTTQLLNIEFYYNTPSIVVESNLYLIAAFLIVIALLVYGIKRFFLSKNRYKVDFELVELTLGIGDSRIKYKIRRNYENLEIAHRIFIELITRKAAIPIDEINDVVKEIYDSWYSLFQITRYEIKKLSGKSLQKNDQSEELIKMATDILNKGLRPHLTQYQAEFRKWFEEELDKSENTGKSPQEIQRNFHKYAELIESMKQVNTLLIEYKEQLNKFIVVEGDSND